MAKPHKKKTRMLQIGRDWSFSESNKTLYVVKKFSRINWISISIFFLIIFWIIFGQSYAVRWRFIIRPFYNDCVVIRIHLLYLLSFILSVSFATIMEKYIIYHQPFLRQKYVIFSKIQFSFEDVMISPYHEITRKKNVTKRIICPLFLFSLSS